MMSQWVSFWLMWLCWLKTEGEISERLDLVPFYWNCFRFQDLGCSEQVMTPWWRECWGKMISSSHVYVRWRHSPPAFVKTGERMILECWSSLGAVFPQHLILRLECFHYVGALVLNDLPIAGLFSSCFYHLRGFTVQASLFFSIPIKICHVKHSGTVVYFFLSLPLCLFCLSYSPLFLEAQWYHRPSHPLEVGSRAFLRLFVRVQEWPYGISIILCWSVVLSMLLINMLLF